MFESIVDQSKGDSRGVQERKEERTQTKEKDFLFLCVTRQEQ